MPQSYSSDKAGHTQQCTAKIPYHNYTRIRNLPAIDLSEYRTTRSAGRFTIVAQR